MDLAELRAGVGAERFDQACEWAWSTARGTGSTPEPVVWPGDLADVPHELHDLWARADVPVTDRLAVGIGLYRAMPCYPNTTGPSRYAAELGPAGCATLWAEVRSLLDDSDDRLADPVGYALWCDAFENPDLVAEAWAQVLADAPSDRRLARVLDASGPVPWPLKRELYHALATEPRWHEALAAALVASGFDYFGSVDTVEAAGLLQRLTEVDDVRGVPELRRRLRGT